MAYKPGDLVKMYSGKVVEIISTDAEGRLLLADSLAYASELKPAIMIDVATLTGACVVALGQHACGVMGNDKKAVDRVIEAGKHANEKAWELPLWDVYSEDIKGQFSHLKNAGGRWGGAITAGAFLKEFVGKTPWVHMDIAGMAWVNDPKPHLSAGATGFGVRTLVQYVLDRER
jgi:leucyl aminopeptidase